MRHFGHEAVFEGPETNIEVPRVRLPHQTAHPQLLNLIGVRADAFSLTLGHFASGGGAGKDKKRVLLVLDRVGWHTSGEVEVPEGIELEFLPARSPELQPAERLWTLVNERVANRMFKDLDELEEALLERCLVLSGNPDLLRGYTRYHWWPEVA